VIRRLADVEKETVLAAIRETRDIVKAADALGIGRTTIYRWLHKWGYHGIRNDEILDQIVPHVET
jgi:transcriptional regulator of acetoin/glycerol metabolism